MESTIRECLVSCTTSQGSEIRGCVQRMMRYEIVFEIYSPGTVLQSSEVLSDFQIVGPQGRLYSGRAIVTQVVPAGLTLVCQASLEDAWGDVDFLAVMEGGRVREEFTGFFGAWQKLYRVRSGFKVTVADLQTFLMDLRLWLEQVELGVRSAPTGDRAELERRLSAELGAAVLPPLSDLFERFEHGLVELEEFERPVHRVYARRQLHPLVLCAPFVYRTFAKPLGYAGDYEMVNMILRDPHEGGSLFAKMVNLWFVGQAPAEAHRNRIDHLTQRMTEEVTRVRGEGRVARIFSLGCGPAVEVQRLLQQGEMPRWGQFTLVDFNQETLLHAQSVFQAMRNTVHGEPSVRFVRKSVGQLLKEAGKSVRHAPDQLYDVVSCAGLFDYLSDPICRKLTSVLHDLVAPGGLLVLTNVSSINPRRQTMESLLEWSLIYRDAASMQAMVPAGASDHANLCADLTGVNYYLEIRKDGRGAA